jgi:diguanylate cyclase (GGDEF)-like protein/PAS domain S-box-containing protein
MDRRQLEGLVNDLPGVAYRRAAAPGAPIRFASAGVEELTGYSPAEIRALPGGWDALVCAEDLPMLAGKVEATTGSGTRFSCVYRITHRSGRQKWVLDSGRVVRGRRDEPLFIDGFMGDITEQKEAEERARWIATHDSLTLLPNRLMFGERIDALLRRDPPEPFAVVLLDVDEFKRVNDTLGHDTGDGLLVSLAGRLLKAMQPGDLVARLGGDEFACLLGGVDSSAEAARRCAAILAGARDSQLAGDGGGRFVDCHASLGASQYPLHGSTRAELMKHADIALYAAKKAGKDRYRLFAPAMGAQMQRHVSMLSMGREALRTGQVMPHYQPKIDFRTGGLIGFEALLRWTHPRHGMRLPGEIAACFADAALAPELSRVMLTQVLRDMAVWNATGIRFGHVALNLAESDFNGGVDARLLSALDGAGLPPEALQVEVTESVFMGRDSREVARALGALSAAGVSVALDNFGTGFASLSHLMQFPVDVLKIDGSFVSAMDGSSQAKAIIAAIVTLAGSLGLTTVAEGIERPGQSEAVRNMGCTHGQGFLFSPAVAAANVPALIARFTRQRLAA